ncbi:DNA ligase [uncultured Caudovirales phage]|uniref:DNA ligase n=1 Tax=uncultured Caudovirales phage TaxID=2100421 RepID=A0A6J5PT47_9CAUD|nr:DNA ligase [uncultured Caudovirales phage]
MHHTQDFKELREFVNEMNSSNSTNHKVDILTKYQYHPFIKRILFYTYHPYWNFGVTSANLKKREDLIAPLEVYDDFFMMLDDFNKRNLTGHSAIEAINRFIKDYAEWADLIYQIIDRNLETRATVTLINRVNPKFIPTFEVALAHDAAKVKGVDIFDGTWFVSRKLDGVRCICFIQDGEARFFSRNGKEFLTLGKVAEEIKRLGITDLVLDGELCLMNEDGSDDFQGILKQIQRKDHTIENPRYQIFDILLPREFAGDLDSYLFSSRIEGRTQWLNLDDSNILEMLPQVRITDEDALEELKAQSKDSNWEGLIARRDTRYKSGRSKDMLKIKEFFDAEYVVTGLIMGPQRVIVNGKEIEEEMLSAVTIDHEGSQVQVGSGFTIEQRRHYYQNMGEIMGATITVQYFEETTDQHGNHSLRFPVFKGNHGKTRSI